MNFDLLKNNNILKLPLLNGQSSSNVRSSNLVRFRGMIQDILGPETYSPAFEQIDKITNSKVRFFSFVFVN